MADTLSLSGQELSYPIGFDLRIIYILAQGAQIREDLVRILAERDVAWTLMQDNANEGATYGRFGVRLVMQSREQMYATYEDLGRLAYVKAVI